MGAQIHSSTVVHCVMFFVSFWAAKKSYKSQSSLNHLWRVIGLLTAQNTVFSRKTALHDTLENMCMMGLCYNYMWGKKKKKSLYRCSHVCILSFLSFWEKLPDSHLSELFSSIALSWPNSSALITIACKGWTLCEYRLLEAGWSTHVASTCTAFTWCSCWIMLVTNLFFTATG